MASGRPFSSLPSFSLAALVHLIAVFPLPLDKSPSSLPKPQGLVCPGPSEPLAPLRTPFFPKVSPATLVLGFPGKSSLLPFWLCPCSHSELTVGLASALPGPSSPAGIDCSSWEIPSSKTPPTCAIFKYTLTAPHYYASSCLSWHHL